MAIRLTMIYPKRNDDTICHVSYKVVNTIICGWYKVNICNCIHNIFNVFPSVTISFFRNILFHQHPIKVLNVFTSWVGRTSVTK